MSPHGCIISARKNSLGQSQSTHVFVCFFFFLSKERKRREKKGREKEKREGGRRQDRACGVGEKWIKKITKWRVLTLRTQWWYLEHKWPKNGSFYPPFSDENTRLRKLSNSPISNSHTSKIRSQISQFRTWTTFNPHTLASGAGRYVWPTQLTTKALTFKGLSIWMMPESIPSKRQFSQKRWIKAGWWQEGSVSVGTLSTASSRASDSNWLKSERGFCGKCNGLATFRGGLFLAVKLSYQRIQFSNSFAPPLAAAPPFLLWPTSLAALTQILSGRIPSLPGPQFPNLSNDGTGHAWAQGVSSTTEVSPQKVVHRSYALKVSFRTFVKTCSFYTLA